MTSVILRAFSALGVPGGFLLLAAALFLRWAHPASVAEVVRVYPYAVFAAGLLLGWRFSRSRVVLAILTLALAERALFHFASPAAGPTDVARLVFASVAFLLPLNLAGFSLLTAPGTQLGRDLVGLSVLAGQAFVLASLCLAEPSVAASWLERALVEAGWLGWTPVPQSALLAFGLLIPLFAVRAVRERRAVDHGFLWALVAAFLALHASRGGPAATFYLATAGLVFVICLIEASYTLAYRDELTLLPGRRALNEARQGLSDPYAVAMVDIDHFKNFNDQYGHKVGDQVLRMVAAKLERISGGGRAFRYGGEEFAVLFPGKGVEEVAPHLEAVRETIASSRFVLRGRGRPRKKPKKPRGTSVPRKGVSVTVSIGVAESSRRYSSPEQVIQAADEALYRAKKAGRNQVKA